MDILSLFSILVMVGTVAYAVRKKADWTPTLILGNLVIFFLTILSLEQQGPFSFYSVVVDLGFRPIYLTTGENIYTILTQMFTHSSITHILFNMLFLYLIGTPLESRIGGKRFAAVYFAAGIIGVLAESLAQWGSVVLIVGASGAISGAMGAMLILYPRDEIAFFLGPIFLPRIPVWIGVGSWFGLQVLLAFWDSGPVAYTAHLGGFLAGVALAYIGGMDTKKEGVRTVEVSELSSLATTPELKNILDRIDNETEEEVRRAWLEYFAERAICPACGTNMRVEGNKIKCECGYEAKIE